MAELAYPNLNLNDASVFEPLRANRFLITFSGVDIPAYLFRKYKIFNVGDDLIFKTEFFETVNFSFNPADLVKITGVIIEYLDPTGAVVNSLKFEVEGINYKIKQSYASDELQTNKFRIVINKKTMKLTNKNI
jgi:hypothetical protein